MHTLPPTRNDGDLFISIHPSSADAPESPINAPDLLDDVFGSPSVSPARDSEPPPHDRWLEARESHPSDSRRLHAEHTTAGYREGITAAKATSIQAGFDEGYGLGATLGLKAGQILGLLEAIASSLKENGDQEDDSSSGVQTDELLRDAQKELCTDGIFSEEYWNPDGMWKFEADDPGDGAEVVFETVAEAHPLVAKWTRIVNAGLERWNIRRDVLGEVSAEPVSLAQEKKEIRPDVAKKKPLDW